MSESTDSNKGIPVIYGFDSDFDIDHVSESNSLYFPDDGIIDMNIQSMSNYMGYSYYSNNCLEMVNITNGQLIYINLDKKTYQIYKVSNDKHRSKIYSFDFKNQREKELYEYAKGQYNGFFQTDCCSIN